MIAKGVAPTSDDAGSMFMDEFTNTENGVSPNPSRKTSVGITDKEFYKEMQKLKDRGSSAMPPKKSASAYIIFGKNVSFIKSYLLC